MSCDAQPQELISLLASAYSRLYSPRMSPLPAKSLSLIPDDPELVFGLIGPLGANLAAVEAALQKALDEVSYACEHISLSSAAEELARDLEKELVGSEAKEHKQLIKVLNLRPTTLSASPKMYEYKMNVGNQLRRLTDMPDALAILAVLKILDLRKAHHRRSQD